MFELLGPYALMAAWLIQLARADSNNNTLCGKSDFWNSTTVPYSFNTNAWGDDGSGFSCMSILDEGTSFSVNYKWTGDASTVKAFPYMKVFPSNLPMQLWNVSALEFSGQWRTFVDGTENESGTIQAQAFDDTAVKVNVAMDMFLSDNGANSTSIGPPIEVMIWLWYVPDILPLGYDQSTPQIDTVEVAGTNFSLYHGYNAQQQHVFSWLAAENQTSSDADYAPLLKYLWKKGILSGALYFGQLEFGTEVMHAGLPTTFEASNYTLKIIEQGAPDDPNKSTSSTSATATPTAGSSSGSNLASTTTSGATSTPSETAKSESSLYTVATRDLSFLGWTVALVAALPLGLLCL